MSQFITITGVQGGLKRPVFPNWQLPYPTHKINLRELIGQIVQAEVEAFHQRQQEQRTIKMLTVREIERGITKGKISSGGREFDSPAVTDTHLALTTALEAFTDGLYFVFIDGNQIDDLDTPINLMPNSVITFLRLVALAGG